MNIKEYQQEVKRTMPDLGSLLLNSLHMTTGMATEIMEELTIAMEKKDFVNISEELADAQWYACNYATIYGIELQHIYRIPYHERRQLTAYLDDLNIHIGRLLDYDKKELAYGKKNITAEQRAETLNKVLYSIEATATKLGVDMREARQKVVNKLRLRYPEKFDADKAINRDTAAERKILEE
jgi:NTP pyrophosphatase (non-canonical NTP hydrolase)